MLTRRFLAVITISCVAAASLRRHSRLGAVEFAGTRQFGNLTDADRQDLRMRPYCRFPDAGTGDVNIWLDVDENSRALSFGKDDTTEQSSMQCVGKLAADCLVGRVPIQSKKDVPDCKSLHCPCKPDTSKFDWPILNQMMQELVPLCSEGERRLRLLLVGLGGGQVPTYLANHCPKSTLQVDSIEYNQNVIDAAVDFFGLHVSPEANKVECNDGLKAVQQRASAASPPQYDAAVVDCFGADDFVPAPCKDPQLLKSISALLRPGGLVFQNLDIEPPAEISKRYGVAFGEGQVKTIPIGMLGQHLIRAQKASEDSP